MVNETSSLFDEATDELRSDIAEALDAAEGAIPEEDELQTVEETDILSALEGLQRVVTVDEIENNVAEAQKWFLVADEAGGLEEQERQEFEERINMLKESIEVFNRVNSLIEDELIPSLEVAQQVVNNRNTGDEQQMKTSVDDPDSIKETPEDEVIQGQKRETTSEEDASEEDASEEDTSEEDERGEKSEDELGTSSMGDYA